MNSETAESFENPQTFASPESSLRGISDPLSGSEDFRPLGVESGEAPPSAEIATSGLDVEGGVRVGLSALSGGPEMNATKTGERSTRFWAAVEPAKRDLLSAVHADLGDVEDKPQTLLGLAEAYSEARLFRTAMYLRLIDTGGPITGKGRTKALYTAYLSALDRETKLAQLIGLERRSKKVDLARLHSGLEAR